MSKRCPSCPVATLERIATAVERLDARLERLEQRSSGIGVSWSESPARVPMPDTPCATASCQPPMRVPAGAQRLFDAVLPRKLQDVLG